MKLPAEARLVGASASDVKWPKSVRSNAGAPDALVVLRDADTPALAAPQIPEPTHGGVFLFPDEARESGFLGRFRAKKMISRATRATALLARGYVDIGASDIDGLDWVYGRAPNSGT